MDHVFERQADRWFAGARCPSNDPKPIADRWLGQNRSVTATNDRLWLATGNNATFGGDLARRIATAALNPPEANHHLRTNFKIKDLDAWMQQHRGELLAAILTVARG